MDGTNLSIKVGKYQFTISSHTLINLKKMYFDEMGYFHAHKTSSKKHTKGHSTGVINEPIQTWLKKKNPFLR